MRLIDADSLIDELGISDEDIIFEEMLEDAPTIDVVPQWVPCEERMPEKYDQYLCCTREGIFHTPCLDDSELSIRWAKDEDVVAWMPLPEPYKGERRDDETDKR